MLMQIWSLVGALYEAVGPGLVLAAALPVSLTLMALVVREGLRRMRSAA